LGAAGAVVVSAAAAPLAAPRLRKKSTADAGRRSRISAWAAAMSDDDIDRRGSGWVGGVGGVLVVAPPRRERANWM